MPSRAPEPAAVYRVTYIEALPGRAETACDLLRAIRADQRSIAGNLRCDLLQRIGRPEHFVLLDAWRRGGSAAAQFVAALEPLLAGPCDMRSHGGLVVANGIYRPAEDAPSATLYAVTHVDVVPPQKDAGVALLVELAESARVAEGNLGFEVWQQSDRPNHLSVVETWRDRAAFDAHVAAPAMRQFRAGLTPLSGALFDQRLFGAVA